MATTPFIFHLGTDSGQGPLPQVATAAPFFATAFHADPRLLSAVPCNADGSTASTFVPWYDGSASSGTGAMMVYNHIPGAIAGSLGSAWQAAGVGCGPDATYMRAFWQRVYTTAPYFHCAKYLSNIGVHGYGVASGGRTALEAELVKMVAAAATVSNTLSTELIIIDLSERDIAAWSTYGGAYQANLTALIAWLRATLPGATNAKVIIPNPHPNLRYVSQLGGAITCREIHYTLARTLTGIGLVDMSEAEFAPPNTSLGSVDPTGDPRFYTFRDTLALGTRIVDTFIAMRAGTYGEATLGMPVYLMIGDSTYVGGMSAVWLALSASGDLGGTRAPKPQYVYNGGTLAIEYYNPVAGNSNTLGSVTSAAGPDITITDDLATMHPNGFVLIKSATNGSSLCDPVNAAGGAWDWLNGTLAETFVANVRAAFGVMVRDMDWIPDLRGMFVALGDNDAYSEATGTLFAERIASFVARLRRTFGTRTSGSNFPIAWRRPYGTGSTHLNQVARATIRAAVDGMASVDSNFHPYSVDSLEMSPDGIHLSNEGQLHDGRLAVEAITAGAI